MNLNHIITRTGIVSLFLCFATLTGCKTFSSLLSTYPDKKDYFLYIEQHWKKCETTFIYPIPKSETDLACYSDRYLIGLSIKEVKILLGEPSIETDTTLNYPVVYAVDCAQAKSAIPLNWIFYFPNKKLKFSYKPPLIDPPHTTEQEFRYQQDSLKKEK